MPSMMDEMERAGLLDPEPAPPSQTVKKSGGKPAAPAGENKRDRFVRIMEPRVQHALDAIRIVGLVGGSNKSRYDYGPSDVDAILIELTEAIATAGDRLNRKPRQLKMFALPRVQQPNGG